MISIRATHLPAHLPAICNRVLTAAKWKAPFETLSAEWQPIRGDPTKLQVDVLKHREGVSYRQDLITDNVQVAGNAFKHSLSFSFNFACFNNAASAFISSIAVTTFANHRGNHVGFREFTCVARAVVYKPTDVEVFALILQHVAVGVAERPSSP